MAITFNAIDVEIADRRDLSSICQIGIVHIQNGKIVDQWKSLINPETKFNSRDIRIHGIVESDVESSPTIPEVQDELYERLDGSVLVSHTNFDEKALNKATTRYGLKPLQVQWLDSVKIARYAWPGYSNHKLPTLAQERGISFKHHDALEDAIVAAKIVLDACNDCKTDIPEWLERVKPSSSRKSKSKSIRREGNKEGKLYEKITIVFTGTFEKSKEEMADLADKAGAKVSKTVSRQTTHLVVGTQDIRQLKGYTKSRNHRKAEELGIPIISESDFEQLIKTE